MGVWALGVPEKFLAILGAAALFLILLRLALAIASLVKRPPRPSLGKSMTIGDREVQEDHYAVTQTRMGLLAVLADGMGKAYGGKIASRIAVDAFVNLYHEYNAFENPAYFFRRAFSAANREILSQLDDGRGAACVAAAMIKEMRLFYAAVGNPKIAVFRNGDLVPLSQGQTIDVLARKRFQEGKISRESAVALLEKHRLYNYVGQDGFHEIELLDTPVSLKPGDIVALMSDGLYESVPWREIEDVLAGNGDCEKMALQLIERVNRSRKDDRDNASVVLIRA